MAKYYDLLQIENELIGMAIENKNVLLETPSIIQGFGSYVESLEVNKQNRVPSVYYKQATGTFDATATYYIWRKEHNAQTDTYTWGFFVVVSPDEEEFNEGLYYFRYNEPIDSSVWLNHKQIKANSEATIPSNTYYTYSLNNGVAQFDEVLEPTLEDYNAGKYFVLSVYAADDKSLINALNDLATRLNADQVDIDDRLVQLRTEVNTLKQQIVIQETPIGTIYTDASGVIVGPDGLPTDAYLDQFVEDNTSPSRTPENGDVIIVVKVIPTATDEIYKYIYSGNAWMYYQIPGMQSATNTAKGIIKGTYVASFTGLDEDIVVDIDNGEIVQIYINAGTAANPSYKTLKNYIEQDSGKIDNVLVNNVLQQIQTYTIDGTTYYKAINIALKTVNGTSVLGSGNIQIDVPVKAVALGSTDLTPDANGKITIPTVAADMVPFIDLGDITDTTPTANSGNLITSGGVKTALDTKLDKPAIAGTNGQILTSDGQGGQSWEDPVEAPIQSIIIEGESNPLTPDSNGQVTIPAEEPDTLDIDATPTLNSTHLVESGGVKSALDAKTNLSVIAPSYDSTSTYAVGDIVIYNGVLYKCTTAISTAEAWDATHWTAKDVDTVIRENQPDLSNYVDKTSAQTITGAKRFSANMMASTIMNYSGFSSITFDTNTLNLFANSLIYVNANSFVPSTDDRTNLGSSSMKWKNLYLSGNLTDGTNSISVANIVNKQDATDNSLNTTSKTVVGAINEVDSLAKGCQKAIAYTDYSSLITALNSASATQYIVGQNFYIQTLEVPDVWICAVESSSVSYTYTTDAAFITATATSGGCQVGYYKIAQLETQKVDISNKLDKVTTSTTRDQVYMKLANGTQTMLDATQDALGGSVVRRNTNGQINVPATPTADSHATSKSYVDTEAGKKLTKVTTVTTTRQAYTKSTDGTSQDMIDIYSGSAVALSLVMRDANGDVIVPSTPTSNSGATPKSYVDDGLGGKLDKVTGSTTYHQAYYKTTSGSQAMLNLSSTSLSNSLMSRDGNGRSQVEAPSADKDIANKKYVDDQVGTKVSSVTPTTETWTFTLDDDSTVTRTVVTGVTVS